MTELERRLVLQRLRVVSRFGFRMLSGLLAYASRGSVLCMCPLKRVWTYSMFFQAFSNHLSATF